MRTYAETQTLILQRLQDTGLATYDATELGYWFEECLKDREFNKAFPHIVPVVFQIESRKGSDTAGTGSSLTDTTKSQFVAGDATGEKVVHNTKDDTWAVILANSSTSVNTLSADIMASGESYEIYNKRCWNNKQIYIGDVNDYLWIESVEYPIGTRRNWMVYGEVLEIDVDSVKDSDSTLGTLAKIDVIVRFAKPHRLNQLTDWAGEVVGAAIKGATTVDIDGMGSTEIIERGDEFYLENKRYTYTITTEVTTSANAATIVFYPGLEDATVDDDDITFVKSTLSPDGEEIFAELVTARAMQSDKNRYINSIPKGGQDTWANYERVAQGMLEEVRRKLNLTKPISKRLYHRE